MTALTIPEAGPERLRFVDERLALVRRTVRDGDSGQAVELLSESLRAGLWSHSRLWSELLRLPDEAGYPLIRALWLQSPRRCHHDLSIIRVVARSAAEAGEHDEARTLLRKAILRQGYRRRRLRARVRRLRRTAEPMAAALRRRSVARHAAAALTDLAAALSDQGARPFLTGESLRRHALGAGLTGSLEVGVLATELPADRLDHAFQEVTAGSPVSSRPSDAGRSGFEIGTRSHRDEALRLIHTSGVTLQVSVYEAADDDRLWRTGPGLRWRHARFALAALPGRSCVPDPIERYLAESYPNWRAVAEDFDPRLDAPNVEVTDQDLFDTMTFAALLDSLVGETAPAYRRYTDLLREAGEGTWIGRLGLRDS